MRNFDNWNRYQDNDRNPLHGCIQFMVKDGNTVAPIYDSDGTVLANPQITDIYGRTQHQVFVDTDVIAYYYKYIGQGIWTDEEDIDTSDVSKWSLQYTSESGLDLQLDITSDTVVMVSNMADLRSTDVDGVPLVDGKKVITLLGYYNLGDKEPINYVWDPESTALDDGGSVIASDDYITGRWIMVQPTEHCDSRHFGVFPSNSSNMDDQTYGIIRLFDYCNSKDIRPYFNGNEDYRWFKYTNVNLIADEIDVTDDTRFNDQGINTIAGKWNGEPRFTNGNTTVVCKSVKTSWNAAAYTGYDTVLIDSDTPQKNWSNAKVDVRVSRLYGYNFNNCVISENGNIGSDNVSGINNTFVNCKLNERMFITSGPYEVSLAGLCTGCQIDPDDFRNSMPLYRSIRQTMDPNPYFDYRDYQNVGKPISNYAANKITSNTVYVTNLHNDPTVPVTLENLNGQVTHFILDGVTGNYRLPANCTVTIKNSDVTIRLAQNLAIIATDSNINLDSTVIGSAYPTASFRECVVTGDTTVEYRFASFTSYDSIISVAVAAGNTVLKNSQINYEYRMVPEEGTPITVTYGENQVTVSYFIHGYISDNIFNNVLYIDSFAAASDYNALDALVDGLTIVNNKSNYSTEPWRISRLGAMNDDRLNTYKFSNNLGFLSETVLPSVPVQYVGPQHSPTRISGALVLDNGVHVLGCWHDDPSLYFCNVQLFTIGTEHVSANVEIMLEDIGGVGTGVVGVPGYAPSFATAHATDNTKHTGGYAPDLQYYTANVWRLRNFVIGYDWLTDDGATFKVRVRQALT